MRIPGRKTVMAELRVVVCAVAASLAAIAPAAARQITSPLLFDRDLSVGSGATIVATGGEALARAEYALIPHRLLPERGALNRTANIAYRWLKLTYFDLPQEAWLVVANHEVFGHGGRLRERFSGPIRYHIGLPVPHGSGGGSTEFEFDREPTVYELLAVSAGGMEVDAVAARTIAHVAFARQRLRPRDAMRYLFAEFDTFDYIIGTGDTPEEPGHDVSDFLQIYNELATQVGAKTLTARTLRQEALIALANPMAAYAFYAIGRYVWDGAADMRVRAPSIAGVRFLPVFRYALTPYGTEWSVTNELAGRVPPMQLEVRVGRAGRVRPWAFGVHRAGLTSWRGWVINGVGAVWRQPQIVGSLDADLRWGGAIGGRGERSLLRVWFSAAPASLLVDVQIKSGGYIPGEPLRAGLVVRAGIGVPFQ